MGNKRKRSRKNAKMKRMVESAKGWDKPKAPKPKRATPSDYISGSGIIAHGKHKGSRLSDISDLVLSGFHGSAIDGQGKYPQSFTDDVISEMARRKQAKPHMPQCSVPTAATGGRILWGHCKGERIIDQSDDAIRGAIWAAEKGVGKPEYLAELQSEHERRDSGPVDADFRTIASSF